MVRIAKLTLKNFKSFKKAEIPFSKGFTVIAGSNGSGKSNILDAIMFAFGITSLKMLRASKLTDLINNNSVENYAKVDLVLKDKDKKFEISRMIDKKGKSVYRLDGQRKTLNEIISLLEELGIKATGHNIIVQGDTTRIIEMSPLERRQIIDDIAGLKEFDEKKEEALKELEKVDARIKEATIVLKERENYLKELEKEREVALQFESLEEEKKQCKATLLYTEIQEIEKKLQDNKEKNYKIEEEKHNTEEKIEELIEKNKVFKEKINELNEKIINASKRTYSTIGSEIEEFKSMKKILDERISNKKELIARNLSKIRSLNERNKELLNEMNLLEKEAEEINEKIPQIKAQLSELKEQKQLLERNAMEKSDELKKLEDEFNELNEKLNQEKEELFNKNAELESLKKEKGLQRKNLDELSEEIDSLNKKIIDKTKKKDELKALQLKYPNLKEKLKTVVEEFEKNYSEMKENEAKASSIKKAVRELGKKIVSCPICESPLNLKKRKELLAKKENDLKKAEASVSKFSKRSTELVQKRKMLEKAVEREKQLLFELKDFEELKKNLKEKKSKAHALKTFLKKSSKTLENNILDLKKRISELESQRKEKENKIHSFKESVSLEHLNELNDSFNNLQTEKNSLEQRLKAINEQLYSKIERAKKEIVEDIQALKNENEQLEKEIENLEKECRQVEIKLDELDANLKNAEKANKSLIEEKNVLDERLEKNSARISTIQQRLKKLEQSQNEIRVEDSKLEVRLTDLKEEFKEFQNVKRLKEFDLKNLQKRIEEIEKTKSKLGAINMRAIESYNDLKEEVDEISAKCEKLEEERLAVLEMIEKIEVKRTNVFLDCFRQINKNFNQMFFNLFGGEGHLSLSDEKNPLEAGLIIEAKHKGESLQNIDSMSGGEKSLTALAFLFAIQLYEPAPFYIFDEADAALDFENSLKLSELIKKVSVQSQFIAISHNEPLIKEADQIIGVALNKQKSSVIGLKLKEKMAVA